MITPFTTAKRDTNKPRILIVDDNPRFSHSARLILQESGQYVVCEENEAASAVETARSFKSDLVLVDLIMAQEDGIEVAAQLEADWALHGVPIVFLTSLITAAEAKDGRRVYGHRILPKPTGSSELIELVEQNLPCCAEG